MCSRTTCKKCDRPMYRGCGNHVEQVLGDVPKAERCQCASAPAAPKAKRGWFGARR